MSTVFGVPCPGCGHEMDVRADGDVQCVACDRRYHARMGHLFALDDQCSAQPMATGPRPVEP